MGVCEGTGETWTKIAGPYWPGFVVTVEKSVRESSRQLKSAETVQRSGCWVVGDTSVLNVMQQMGAGPSGKRSAHSIAVRVSSDIQAVGRAPPSWCPMVWNPRNMLVLQ